MGDAAEGGRELLAADPRFVRREVRPPRPCTAPPLPLPLHQHWVCTSLGRSTPLPHPSYPLQVSVWNSTAPILTLTPPLIPPLIPPLTLNPTCKVSVFNSTTITYTAEICVEIAPDAGGGTPRVRFVRMEHMCR